MSKGPRVPLAHARELARTFGIQFQTCFDRWIPAGSIRRKREMIGDVEHVVIPRIDPATGVNLLWRKLDSMVAEGKVTKALYGTPDPDAPQDDPDLFGAGRDKPPGTSYRWGPIYRGVMCDGIKHEIFCAEPRNLGYILAIRTGPEEFSKHLVTILGQGGIYVARDGFVRYASGVNAGEIRGCPSEPEFFELCRFPFLPPNARDGLNLKLPPRSYAR